MKIKSLIKSLLTFISVYSYISIYVHNNYVVYGLYILLLFVLYMFYHLFDNNIILDKKYKIFTLIMSIIFTIMYSYEVTSSIKLFLSNIIISIFKIIGHYLFYKVVLYYFIKFLNKEYTLKWKILKKYNGKPFIYSLLFLGICYGIYLIMYYPGIFNYDNANQVFEVMGIHTRYLDAIIPISNGTLTNFNPILHTLLLGGLARFGHNLGSINFGIFLYTIIQLIVVVCTYSYTLYYSVKKGINPVYSFFALLFLGLVPLFGFYSITAVKDTLYTCFVVLFSLKIYDIYKKDEIVFKDYLHLFLISILVVLFRTNGIILVLLSIPFIVYKSKKFIMVICSIILFFGIFNNVILPYFGVSNTSIREGLSIPFQMTARLVKYHDKDIDEKDKIIIGKILDYDSLSFDYNEDLADPVKNKFNKYYNKEELVDYYKVFNKYLWKYPGVYLDAWVNGITGYVYPFENRWKVYHKLNPKLSRSGFNYHYNKLELGRNILFILEIATEASFIGLLLNIGFITWISILLFIMLHKNKKYIFLIPNIISILFCVLSPANTYYRYIYPSLVIMVTLFPIIKYEIESMSKK